jgi:dGTPase
MERREASQLQAEFSGMDEETGVLGPIGRGYEPRACFASHPGQSRGRLVQEPDSPTRTAFQRDRDRIIHSTAFRRLKHKTQVFVAHEGDHYRTRLTHTIEVAQIARALARALRCDEDLAEAVALVHDFGHTPFGHTGEDALDVKMRPWGGFDHNVQALRVVTRLERRYAAFDGLNLSWETLEGLVKHNGPLLGREGGSHAAVAQPIVEFDAVFPLDLATFASLEAQCAAVADDIAYNAHDIDDGLRSRLLTLEMLEEVPFTADILGDVRRHYPRLDAVRLGHELVRRQITIMVEDVIASARTKLSRLLPASSDAVRGAGETIVGFSDAMRAVDHSLKVFLHSGLYRHPSVMEVRARAETIVHDLFDRYMDDPALMTEGWGEGIGNADEARRARRVADFLAGMTDTYAIREHRRLFDRTPQLG